jgi:hypothetical protein
MLTVLDFPTDSLDPAEKSFVANLRECGWVRTGVSADVEGPGFSYTTGFWLNTQKPELIMFGMQTIAHDVFWNLYRDSHAGRGVPVGSRTDRVFANLSAYAFPVSRRYYPEHLGWNRWFYAGDSFPCLQIVWPDRSGVFPWEIGFDPAFAGDQPDLTESGWVAALAN